MKKIWTRKYGVINIIKPNASTQLEKSLLPEFEQTILDNILVKTSEVLHRAFAENIFTPLLVINNELNEINSFFFEKNPADKSDLLLSTYERFINAMTVAEQQKHLHTFVKFQHEELKKELLAD